MRLPDLGNLYLNLSIFVKIKLYKAGIGSGQVGELKEISTFAVSKLVELIEQSDKLMEIFGSFRRGLLR